MLINEDFLKFFNDLERHLRIEYNDGRFSESSFMGTLYRIKGKKSNPIISDKDNFEILSQAAQLRNIMVHNEGVAEPTEEFLIRFKKVVNRIIRPKRVLEVMRPIRELSVACLDDSIEDMINLMKKNNYSNIPVVENHKLKGVFTERTLFHYMMMDNKGIVKKDMKMQDLLEAMDLDNDPTQYFDFIPKDIDIYEALISFEKDYEEDRELEILFVTEHGLSSEAILGIITVWDLKQAFL
ncbi:MAG: CBS domain-containing protein [Firmicutes bacterium]|nr:CBS domain-containing protein [Bacillota bacterium]